MSDLQLAIALLGAIGVAAVVGYNAWVARRHRRLGERVLRQPAGDPLLDGEMPQIPPASAVAVEALPRQEPMFGTGESGDATGMQAPEAHLLSPAFDYAMALHTLDPMSGERLGLLEGQLLREHVHRIVVIGWNDSSGWQRVDPDGAYTMASAALQLADRRGPAQPAEIEAFAAAVRAFAEEVMAVVDAGPIPRAAQQAGELDALCARVDTQVGVNVVGRNMAFSAARLRTLLERHAGDYAEDGSAVVVDPAVGPQFVIFDHDGQPLAPGAGNGITVRGLTFLLDVPRTARGAAVFSRMVEIAKDFAGTLGGELVDDQRLPLTDAALETIQRQIEQQQAAMAAAGIEAGSRLARRVFA